MDINKFRLGMAYIFSENKNIPKKSKLALINFIEHADEHQLKVLAVNGELIKKSTLTPFIREMIDERFSEDYDIQEKIEAAFDKVSEVLKTKK